MKLVDIYENKKQKGTYAGLKFSDKTKKCVESFIKDNKIPNPIDISKLHSTLLYSRKFLPNYKPQGKIETPWLGKFKKFSIFKSNPKNGETNCLVIEYECKDQTDRFNFLMKTHDATYDFDEYKPHLTISYDVGNLDINKLNSFDCIIEIVEEYYEELNIEWNDK